ncbi:MAG: hypothetical protein C0623_00695 [Desulfuromonas sp.]|nr:MAG: hypothetical protein C0623_00695 [Desulfuromonas sp.]
MSYLRPGFDPIVIAVIVLGVFSPIVYAGFNSVDDMVLVTFLTNLDSWSLADIFFPEHGYYYRPLLSITFYFDRILWDLSPQIMHFENVLLHLVNALLVYAIVFQVLPKNSNSRRIWAIGASLLFGCHPIVTESVNLISGRTDLLAGVFILLSILFLLRSARTENKLLLLLSGVFFFVACLAKEVSVFYYPAALALSIASFTHGTGFWRKIALRQQYLYVFSFTCAGYFLLRYHALKSSDSGVSRLAESIGGQSESVFDTLRISLKVMGFYTKKLFIPWPLNFGIINVSDYYLVVGVGLVLLCIVWLLRNDLVSAFFLTATCITSAALLVVLGKAAWTPIAERYLYIATAPFVLGSVAWLHQSRNKWFKEKVLAWGGVVLLTVFVVTTGNRNYIWQDNLLLFEDTVRKSPAFIPAKNQLADALIKKGRIEEAQILIAEVYQKSENKDYSSGYINQARSLAHDGKLESARAILVERRDSGETVDPNLYQELVMINFKRLEATKEATARRAIYQENLQLLSSYHAMRPGPFNLYRIGKAHLSLGNREKAKEYFEKAYQQAPETAHYREPARRLAERLGHK